jgi:hypothetical protein
VVIYLSAGALLGATLFGFLLGHFLLRLKTRWCRTCGSYLQCPDCQRRARYSHASRVGL